ANHAGGPHPPRRAGQAKRHALLLTRGRSGGACPPGGCSAGRVPVVLDMKLILSVMRPAPMPGNRPRALWPVQPPPPTEQSTAAIPQPEGTAAPCLRAVQAHRATVRTAAACDKKNGALDRPNMHAAPLLQSRSGRQVSRRPE